jgi:hypothetical protein
MFTGSAHWPCFAAGPKLGLATPAREGIAK